jgi:hypothetical protein
MRNRISSYTTAVIAAALLTFGSFITGCTKALEDAFGISKVEFQVRKVLDSGVPENLESYKSDFITGVYVHERNALSATSIWGNPVVQNMQFKNTGGVLDGDKLYLDKKKEYAIYSYAPYVAETKLNGEAIPFEHGADVIHSTRFFSSKTQEDVINKVELDYEHLTSKVRFLFEDSRDPSLQALHDFSKMNFKITGFCKQFFLNVYTGKITRGPLDNSVAITSENDPVCFAPATGESEFNLEVIIPSAGNTGLPPVIIRERFGYNFRPGHSYAITINITTSQMTINSHIVSWEYKVVEDLEIETK